MFIKLIHGDQFSEPVEGTSVKPFFTLISNVSKAEYIEISENGHVLYIWDKNNTFFQCYYLDGSISDGCHWTETVYFLNEEGKTIDRYYPNPKYNGIRENK